MTASRLSLCSFLYQKSRRTGINRISLHTIMSAFGLGHELTRLFEGGPFLGHPADFPLQS
jgi:hypothetical protein